MKIPSNEDCFMALIETIHSSVLTGNLKIPPVIWRDADEGKLVFSFVDLPIIQVGGFFYHVVNTTTQEPKCGYLCLAIDMNSLAGQGLEFKEFVLVGEYDPSRAPSGAKTYRDRWRWGVVNYDRASGIIRPIDWDNAYWNEGGHRLRATYGPPLYVWVKTKPTSNVKAQRRVK